MTTSHGCSVNAKAAALIAVQHHDDGRLVVVAIDAGPPDLKALTAAIEAIEGEDDRIVIDAAGLGSALWEALGPPDDERLRLAAERGIERQRIVDPLVAAISVADSLRFAPKLEHQDAMNRALIAFRREVDETGNIGSELVIALALAVRAKPVAEMEPMVAFR